MDIEQYADMEPWEWPDNMAEILLEVLTDRKADAQDRLAAVTMAGDTSVVDDNLAGALVAIVKDGTAGEDLRARAAIALGPALESTDIAMDYEEDDDDEDDEDDDEAVLSEDVFDAVVDALETCYRDEGCPKEVRRRCLEGSVRAPQPWHTEAVRSAYLSGDPEWRLTAVFAMNYIEGFEAEIIESLDSEDGDVRYEAVSAAGSWEVDAAWPKIAALLKDEHADTEILLAAIEAAVNIRPEEVGDAVGPLTLHDDLDIADAASEAIEMAEAMLRLDDMDA